MKEWVEVMKKNSRGLFNLPENDRSLPVIDVLLRISHFLKFLLKKKPFSWQKHSIKPQFSWILHNFIFQNKPKRQDQLDVLPVAYISLANVINTNLTIAALSHCLLHTATLETGDGKFSKKWLHPPEADWVRHRDGMGAQQSWRSWRQELNQGDGCNPSESHFEKLQWELGSNPIPLSAKPQQE